VVECPRVQLIARASTIHGRLVAIRRRQPASATDAADRRYAIHSDAVTSSDPVVFGRRNRWEIQMLSALNRHAP